jgi:hypothetical protein
VIEVARPRTPARLAVVLGAVWCAVLGLVAPAAAHKVGGGKYVSQVTGLTPPTTIVTASIGGGDELLALRVQAGHEVVVPGYAGEPYLRIAPDGTVFENKLSPAGYLNTDRYANVIPPAEATAAAATANPDWRPIGAGGSWVWHDHRIHWMSPKAPPAIKGKESQTVEIQRWQLPLVVDGSTVSVDGLLEYTPTSGGSAWLETGITVGLPLLVIGLLGWWSARAARRRGNRTLETP